MKKLLFTAPAHRRFDVSDAHRATIEPHLPGRKGAWGGIARNNRLSVNAVLWVIRTGAPWRDLPPDLGGWSNTRRRFTRWRDKGIGENLFELLIDDPGMEWLRIDASPVNVHPHGAGAAGGNEGMGHTKGGSTARHIWPWTRLVFRSGRLSRQVPLRIAQWRSR
jgi:transposase